jgi:BirA family biotin operon repressor/biotin-[acetyl-CoA-carboxylase] ligase
MDRLEASSIRVAGLEVSVLGRCTSTNALLRAAPDRGTALLAAELQTAGRGRHGRRWRSARGAGATFSIRQRMSCAQRELAGLSIAVGLGTARALRRLGARGIALKWPNDLMLNRRKLGGILIETLPSGSGSLVIVGIGINCREQPRLGARLGRGVAALDQATRRPLPRNTVIGAVSREVLRVLSAWEHARGQAGAPALERAA